MGSICITYRKDTLTAALQVRAALQQRGYTIWLVDLQARSRRLPRRYRSRAIRESSTIIVLFGESSLDSGRIQHLIAATRHHNKRVIPMLVEPVLVAKLPASRHYIDASNDLPAAIRRLLVSLEKQPASSSRFGRVWPAKKFVKRLHGSAKLLKPNRVALAAGSASFLVVFAITLLSLHAARTNTALIPTLYRIEGTAEPAAVVAQGPDRPQATPTSASIDTPLPEETIVAQALPPADRFVVADTATIPETNATSSETPEAIAGTSLPGPTANSVVFAAPPDSIDPGGGRPPANQVAPSKTPRPPASRERPVASFSAEPERGEAPLTVTFGNQSAGDITAYAWDFDGDGELDSTQKNPPPFTYETYGSYAARLTLTGSDGSEVWKVVKIKVDPPAQRGVHEKPHAAFYVAPRRGPAPLVVNFSNESSGDITAYAWDFDGDRVIDSTEADPPSFTYERPGLHFASLTVANAEGNTSPMLESIMVDPPSKQVTPVISPATNTPVPTSVPSATPRPTRAVTATPIATATPTSTVSSSPTPTVTETETATDSPTPTATPAPTDTESPSPTATTSPLATYTKTETPDGSPTTETAVPLATATSGPSPSATPSLTLSATYTDTPTPDGSPTSTPTLTLTASFTAAPLPTATDSPTPAGTPTTTTAPSATLTTTALPSITPSATFTHTPTAPESG